MKNVIHGFKMVADIEMYSILWPVGAGRNSCKKTKKLTVNEK